MFSGDLCYSAMGNFFWVTLYKFIIKFDHHHYQIAEEKIANSAKIRNL